MSKIRSKDTTPEMAVRRLAHSLGYRYRLHKKDLPGSPDIVFPKKSKVIFVNGCFWHQHSGCHRANIPRTNQNYWLPKLKRNLEKDQENYIDLQRAGWKVLIIWECETGEQNYLKQKLTKFLSD